MPIDAEAGLQRKEEYRKHPYHQSHWGSYPNISIQQENPVDYGHRKEAGHKKSVHGLLTNVRNKREQQKSGTFYRIKDITLPWLIKQIARFSVIWEIFMYFVIMSSFLLTSFSAFYAFYEKELWFWISIVDMIFAGDTILRLSVEIWRYQARATVVVFTAPYTMFQFMLDVLSMVPLHQFYYWTIGSEELEDLSMIDYFRLNRFLRFSRCVQFFNVMESRRMADEKLMFLFKFSNYYLGSVYFTGCLFVSCIGVEPLDYLLYNKLHRLDTSFLRRFQKNKAGYGSTPWDIFVITTNFATAVITTVGYGDVTPYNELEMAICIVCMLVGAIFLNGYFTSEMTNFEVELDGARFDLYYRLAEIRNFLNNISSLPFFNSKVEEYYNCLWTYREGVYDVSFMRALPESFHEELLFDICQEMFDKSYLFNNLDPAFLRAVSTIVTIAMYNPNMLLCRCGGFANKMYYILQGECQAMSKLNPANPAAIIRAGSIIGEANILFSYPYTTSVETRTCCQFIILDKHDLLASVDKFPQELEILKSRSMQKMQECYENHQAYGVDPVCWVKSRGDMANRKGRNIDIRNRRIMRKGSGLNRRILDDVVDDSHQSIIFHTPCTDQSVLKNHLIPYMSCAIPEILNQQMAWFNLWNICMICSALWFALFGPYCLVFPESSKLEHYVCQTQHMVTRVVSVLYIVDVLVEIIGACPVAGWHYKFWDGFSVVKSKATFYLDILAAVPLDVLSDEDQSIMHILGTIFRVLKLWKVIRYLHYLDNVYPLQVFWFRLAQTVIVVMYSIHFMSCISYNVACPYVPGQGLTLNPRSWLASYEIMFKTVNPNEPVPHYLRKNTLAYENPYLVAFFYSTATLSSAGFGDFNPQNKPEMLWAIGFQLFGFFLCGYYTSVLTSALSCLMRPKLALQQQLVSLYQFMDHYQLRERIKDRIVEYFVLQHQLRGGVSLDRGMHIMYDAPNYLRDDVLFLEVVDLLDGVPVFSKVESEVIIKLSSSMKRFLIPPNTTFVQKGEVRRILYIIKQGTMGIFDEGVDQPLSLLQDSAHFGIRDLLFGEPSHYAIRSLSYVSMYAVRRREFEEALMDDDELWDLVNEEKENIREVIHEMTMIYSALETTSAGIDKATHIPSWVEIPRRVPLEAVEKDRKLAKINLINDEYDELFKIHKFFYFLKLFLLRKTVHPVGYFSKFWNCVMSLVCCLTVTSLMLETFCYMRMPWFRAFQIALDWINFMDIYLKMHWSYYNPNNGMLITHPLKTTINYALNGSLVIDVVVCAPIELLMWLFGMTSFLGYGRAASWYSRLRWFRFFQFKRIPVVFEIAHNVFKKRSMILVTLYVTATVFMCTIVSAVSQFIACPWEGNNWEEGDEAKLPICLKTSWVSNKYSDADTRPAVISGVLRRWVLSLYYVSQCVLVIGFGDMITLQKADIFMLIFMCIFGFIVMRCIVGDMTAAEVDSDQARATFVENMTVLDLVMRREKVPKKLMTEVMMHLRYTWNRSRGLQPRELFADLHPVLESELYKNLIGEKLQKIPLFHSFPPTVLRSICRYLKKEYIRRGERIMRFGNLEYEMYIIIAGKVFITDQYLNYICSLGPGNSLGESALVYGLARRQNAIAATNVELYTLSQSKFETFLGRYPSFKNDLRKNLEMKRRDFFEKALDAKMDRAATLSADRKQKMLKTFTTRSSVVRDLVAHREDLKLSGLNIAEVELRKKNKFFGYGDLDDNLPFLYFCTSQLKKKGIGYPVLHPNCKLLQMFLTLMVWLSFFTPAIAAYEVCFSNEFLNSPALQEASSDSFKLSKILHELSGGIEIVFLVYLFLQFFVAYQVKPGVYNKSPKCIVLRYVTAADGFLYDLTGCFPFLLEELSDILHLPMEAPTKFLETVKENLYLLRVIRLYHYYKMLLSKRNDLDVSTFRLQITLSVTSFVLMAHMLACLFYWISPCTRPDLDNATVKYANLCPPPDDALETNGWTTQYTIDKDIQMDTHRLEAWRWWFRSLYWVVTTISTTGFGDIVPVTIREMAVGIMCIFCGAFILSIILSQFTSGMASLTRTKREYMYQVLLLVKHLKNIGLSEIRQSQVMMYFLTMWERCRGIPYHKILSNLPVSLQIEVAYALFGTTLLKVPFFHDTSERIFIRQLCYRVKHSLCIPGTYIHKDGDPGSKLFVVYKGLVSGTLTVSDGNIELLSIYNPGDAFGKFAAFFLKGTYKKSYRAESMVEVLEVKQKDIVHLAKNFPQFKRALYNFISMKYSHRGANASIFNKERRNAKIFGVGEQLLMAKAVSKARAAQAAKSKAPAVQPKAPTSAEQLKKKRQKKDKKVVPREGSTELPANLQVMEDEPKTWEKTRERYQAAVREKEAKEEAAAIKEQVKKDDPYHGIKQEFGHRKSLEPPAEITEQNEGPHHHRYVHRHSRRRSTDEGDDEQNQQRNSKDSGEGRRVSGASDPNNGDDGRPRRRQRNSDDRRQGEDRRQSDDRRQNEDRRQGKERRSGEERRSKDQRNTEDRDRRQSQDPDDKNGKRRESAGNKKPSRKLKE